MVYYFIFRSKLPFSLFLKIISFFLFSPFFVVQHLYFFSDFHFLLLIIYLIYFFCRAEAAGEVAGGDAPAADAAPAVSA